VVNSADINKLFYTANKIRTDYCGNEVHLRAIIDISNYCTKNCNYCEMREDNFSLQRYRMQTDEIIDITKRIAKLGVGTIVFQSGEDTELDTDLLAYVIYSIKQSTDVAITLSLGERGLDEYQAWKIAGADRYILKFETSNEKKYSIYSNKELLNDRIQHLSYLKRLGYQIGSGNLIGLPNQTIEDLAEDILLLKSLDVDTAIFDSFIPTPFTPYQHIKRGSFDLTLRVIAAARLVLKNVHITSNVLDTISEEREKILNCGANIIMPYFTPEPYRTYSKINNPNHLEVDPFENQKLIKKQIESLGRQISYSRGDSLKKSIVYPH